MNIPRFSQQEFNAILNSQQHFKRLPQSTLYSGLNISSPTALYLSFSLAGIDVKEIDYHSGRMPQMIFFWCQASRGNLQASFDELLSGFKKLAENYYRQKIYKTLIRAQEYTGLERVDIFQVAANVCLNIQVRDLPEIWSISGLFTEVVEGGSSYFACVCPSVFNAFMKYLSDKKNQIIDVLVGDLVSFIGALGRLRC